MSDDQEPVEPRAEVVGYGGKVHAVPARVWFAQRDQDGQLVRDEAGRPIRVRVRYSGA